MIFVLFKPGAYTVAYENVENSNAPITVINMFKFISVIGALLFSTFSYATVNLQSFHNVNFRAVGNKCGLHLEVSGTRLIMTNIFPPEMDASCEKYAACNGSSFLLRCDKNGECFNATDNSHVLVLLEDRNIYNVIDGIKSLRSNETRYSWCP